MERSDLISLNIFFNEGGVLELEKERPLATFLVWNGSWPIITTLTLL